MHSFLLPMPIYIFLFSVRLINMENEYRVRISRQRQISRCDVLCVHSARGLQNVVE